MQDAHLEELKVICGDVSLLVDGGVELAFLPKLALPSGCTPSVTSALLCLGQHGGYSTRLFLPAVIPGRGANWTQHFVAGRRWHTWSWNQVPASLRPAEILAEHLRGLR
jgi:hypothetical protein